MTTGEDIRRQTIRLGAGLVGFADVSCLPVEVTEGLARAVSIAVALDPAVIRDIRDGPTAAYFAEYERANALLDRLTGQVADAVRDAGHRAQAFQATTEQIDKVTLATRLQHKTAATRAGLGWIGKCGLLITRAYGPAVRLGSVLTDAPLETGTPTEVSICGICINVCPWTQRYLARALEHAATEIVSATAEDLQAVRALFREYAADLPFDLSFQNFQEELTALPGGYAPPSGRLLLAKYGDGYAGCVALRQIGNGICEMKRLFVRPALRGKGIGRALARAIIEEARQTGYKRMRLDTVLEPAKCLYRSLGFTEIPPYQHVPVEGVVFMELEL